MRMKFLIIFSDSNLRVEFETDMLIKYTENNNIYYWDNENDHYLN